MSRGSSGLLVLALLAGYRATASAQQIRGEVRGAGAAAPLAGALIQLSDADGRFLARTLTSPGGRFVLQSLGPGTYQVRAAAIGFTPSSVAVAVGSPSDAATAPTIVLEQATQILPDLVAQASRSGCADPGARDGSFARIREATATALGVIEESIRSGQASFETRNVERQSYHWPAKQERADTVDGSLLSWPVRSLDPDSLRERGFGVEAGSGRSKQWTYYGPDARVLFADWFVASHCFVVRRSAADASLFEVQFTPRSAGTRIDLSGTLLLDARTLVPRRLTFQHENLPDWLGEGSAGGEVELIQLGPRLWAPSRWRLYAPIPNGDPRGGPLVSGRAERIGTLIGISRSQPVSVPNPERP